MNILYLFKYKQRFIDIIELISENDKSILELCFGDIHIANTCKDRGLHWHGIDINESFVKYAKNKGFEATKQDLACLNIFPTADVCIMSGSLYHFHNEIELLFLKMLKSAPKIIISEPIINLSSKKGIIGKISKKLTNAGKGNESFRFNKISIINTLEQYKNKLNFKYRIISIKKDILIEITNERD